MSNRVGHFIVKDCGIQMHQVNIETEVERERERAGERERSDNNKRNEIGEAPLATTIGSANFGERSARRDTEAQLTLITSDTQLRAQLDVTHMLLLLLLLFVTLQSHSCTQITIKTNKQTTGGAT
jgi:hypothetical protein